MIVPLAAASSSAVHLTRSGDDTVVLTATATVTATASAPATVAVTATAVVITPGLHAAAAAAAATAAFAAVADRMAPGTESELVFYPEAARAIEAGTRAAAAGTRHPAVVRESPVTVTQLLVRPPGGHLYSVVPSLSPVPLGDGATAVGPPWHGVTLYWHGGYEVVCVADCGEAMHAGDAAEVAAVVERHLAGAGEPRVECFARAE